MKIERNKKAVVKNEGVVTVATSANFMTTKKCLKYGQKKDEKLLLLRKNVKLGCFSLTKTRTHSKHDPTNGN